MNARIEPLPEWAQKEPADFTPEDFLEAAIDIYQQITFLSGEGLRANLPKIQSWFRTASLMKEPLDIPAMLSAMTCWIADEKADRDPSKLHLLYDYLPRVEKLRKLARAARRKKQSLVPSKYCTGRIHLGGACFKVYDFATAISRKKDGECWLSWRTAAKWCGINRDTAGISIHWLVKHGWLEELVAPSFARDGKGHYRVVDHDAWVRAHDASRCVLVAPDRVADDDPPED